MELQGEAGDLLRLLRGASGREGKETARRDATSKAGQLLDSSRTRSALWASNAAWAHAAHRRPNEEAAPTIWSQAVRALLARCKALLESRRAPVGLLDALRVLKRAIQHARGAPGLADPTAAKRVLEMCSQQLHQGHQDQDVLDECALVAKALFTDAPQDAGVAPPQLERMRAAATEALDRAIDVAMDTNRNDSIAARMAKLLHQSVQAGAYQLAPAERRALFENLARWLLDGRGQTAELDKELVTMITGVLEAHGTAAIPDLAVIEPKLAQVARHVAGQVATSALRQRVVRCLQLTIRVHAEYARQWSARPRRLVFQPQLGIVELYRAFFPGQNGLYDMAARFDWVLDVGAAHSGYYAHLLFVADLTQHKAAEEAGLPLETFDEAVRHVQDHAAPPLKVMAWLQFLFVLLREHPLQGPHVRFGLDSLWRLALALHDRLLASWDIPEPPGGRGGVALWALRCLRPLVLTSERERAAAEQTGGQGNALRKLQATWAKTWRVITGTVLPGVPEASARQIAALELATAVLATRLVDPQDVRASFGLIWGSSTFPPPPDADRAREVLFREGRPACSAAQQESDAAAAAHKKEPLLPVMPMRFLVFLLRRAHLFETSFVAETETGPEAAWPAHDHQSPTSRSLFMPSPAGGQRWPGQRRRASVAAAGGSEESFLSPFVSRAEVAAKRRILREGRGMPPHKIRAIWSAPGRAKPEPAPRPARAAAEPEEDREDDEEDARKAPGGVRPPESRRESLLRWALKWLFHVSLSRADAADVDALDTLATLIVALVCPGDMMCYAQRLPTFEELFDLAPGWRTRGGGGEHTFPEASPVHPTSGPDAPRLNLIPTGIAETLATLSCSAVMNIAAAIEESGKARKRGPELCFCFVASVLGDALGATAAAAGQRLHAQAKRVQAVLREAVERGLPEVLGRSGQRQFMARLCLCLAPAHAAADHAPIRPLWYSAENDASYPQAAMRALQAQIDRLLLVNGILTESPGLDRASSAMMVVQDEEEEEGKQQPAAASNAKEQTGSPGGRSRSSSEDSFADEAFGGAVVVQASTPIGGGNAHADADAASQASAGARQSKSSQPIGMEMDQIVGNANDAPMDLAVSGGLFALAIKLLAILQPSPKLGVDALTAIAEACCVRGNQRFLATTVYALADQCVGLLRRSENLSVVGPVVSGVSCVLGLAAPAIRLGAGEMAAVVHMLGRVARQLRAKGTDELAALTQVLQAVHGVLDEDTCLLSPRDKGESRREITSRTGNGVVIPRAARLELFGALEDIVACWHALGMQEERKEPLMILVNTALKDECPVVRLEAARLAPRAMAKVGFPRFLHTWVAKVLKRMECRATTLSGIPVWMPHADAALRQGKSAAPVELASSESGALDSDGPLDIPLDEDAYVLTNWTLLCEIACASKELLAPVLLRFCLFARRPPVINAEGAGRVPDHVIRCDMYRLSLLKSMVQTLARAHAFDSPQDLYSAYALYFAATWLEYSRKCISLDKLLFVHAYRVQADGAQDSESSGDNEFQDALRRFPSRLFGFEDGKQFRAMSLPYWIAAVVGSGLAEAWGSALRRALEDMEDADEQFELAAAVEAICGPLAARDVEPISLKRWHTAVEKVQPSFRESRAHRLGRKCDHGLVVDVIRRALALLTAPGTGGTYFDLVTPLQGPKAVAARGVEAEEAFAVVERWIANDLKHARILGGRAGAKLVPRNHGLVAEVLLHLGTQLKLCTSPADAETGLRTLEQVVTAWWPGYVTNHAISMRLAAGIPLRMLRNGSAAPEACARVLKALAKTMETHAAGPRRAKQDLAVLVIFTLQDCMLADELGKVAPHETLGESVIQAWIKVLGEATGEVASALRVLLRPQVLKRVKFQDPQVSGAVTWEQAATLVASRFGGKGNADGLLELRFDPQLYGPPCAVLLEALQCALTTRLHDVLVSRELLTPLVWALLELSRPFAPHDVRERATKCAGAIGALGPGVADLLGFRTRGPAPSSAANKHKERIMVLAHLVYAVTGHDAGVGLCAMGCIRSLLAHHDWLDARDGLCEDLRSRVEGLAGKRSYDEGGAVEFVPGSDVVRLRLASRRRALGLDGVLEAGRDGAMLRSAVWRACLDATRSFEDWICGLSFMLSHSQIKEDDPLRSAQSLCLLDAQFAALVLPLLLKELTTEWIGDEAQQTAQTEMVEHIKIILKTPERASRPALRVIVNGINYVRKNHLEGLLQLPGRLRVRKGDTQRADGSVLDRLLRQLDLLTTAQAALHCGMASTALRLVELDQFGAGRGGAAKERPVSADAERLLLEAYKSMDAPEALHGFGRHSGLSECVDLDLLNGNLDTGLAGLDGLLQQQQLGESHGTLATSLADTLRDLGLYHLYDFYVQSHGEGARAGVLLGACDAEFEVGWRFLRPVSRQHLAFAKSGSSSYVLYQGLASLIDGDQERFTAALTLGRRQLGKQLDVAMSSGEVVADLYRAQRGAQHLYELETLWTKRWAQPGAVSAGALADTSQAVVDVWNQEISLHGLEFKEAEPLLALRRSMLVALERSLSGTAAARRRGPADRSAAQARHLLFLSKFAREHGLPARARNYLHGISCSETRRSGQFVLEQASVHRDLGQPERAMLAIKSVIQSLQGKPAREARVLGGTALLRAGTWLAESCAEDSETIMSDYLVRAEAALQRHASASKAAADGLVECRVGMATYADSIFRAIDARKKSPEWQQLRKQQNEQKMKMKALRAEAPHSKASKKLIKKMLGGLGRAVRATEAQMERDENEYQRTLSMALEAYLRALGHQGAVPDSLVFRLIALWFDNEESQANNNRMAAALGGGEVPSAAIVPLSYQIASRLASPGQAGFAEAVYKVLKRLATEHPFHTVPLLFALANASTLPEANERLEDIRAPNKHKEAAADALLRELVAGPNHRLGRQVAAMRGVMDGLVALSYEPVGEGQYSGSGSACRPYKACMDAYVRGPCRVPVITAQTPVRVDGTYLDADLDLLHSFKDTYEVSRSGLSKPRFLTINSSSGTGAKCVLKGGDDMRQDAIVQQLFTLVNRLLAGNNRTGRSELRIRTYKVVPLTPMSGVVHFIQNTIPLADYLVRGDNPAHARYARDTDLSFRKALEALAKSKDKSNADKLATYRSVCERFRPVMHHFFLEHFHSPAEWCARRAAYSRSVAVNSIVGYIAGIGDRHLHNMLIDRRTADVVHIDFGIMFDQGKHLSTPELVPFRLTPDIVDGMGVTGTAGTFLSSCEDTLAVLRDSAAPLLCILQVLVHDPLYVWTVSPAKAERVRKAQAGRADNDAASTLAPSQDSVLSAEDGLVRRAVSRASSGASSSAASKRAKSPAPAEPAAAAPAAFEAEAATESVEARGVLLRVERKLEGREFLGSGALPVQGQVLRLINEARDETLLCQMFPGWAPHA